MIDRRRQELQLLETTYGELEIGPTIDWVVIKRWQLPPGWNKTETAVLVLIPGGYPITPPDNFCTDNDLRLANGALPGSSSPNQQHIGQQWLQFSYGHIEAGDWHPDADLLQGHNLLTFLLGVTKRLAEAN